MYFFLWLIFHCVFIPELLYPFICGQTSRLLPCPSYCKQCCNKHWSACIFSNNGFLWIYAQGWDFWLILQLYFQFFKEPPYCSPQWLCQFTFPPTVQEGCLLSTSSPVFVCGFFDDRHSNQCEMLSHCSFFNELIYFNWRLITLQYCSGFCHTLT